MIRLGRRGRKKGFTLIEVMVTAAILALGSVLIHDAFFITLDVFNYCATYFSIASWVDGKMWESANEVARHGPAARIVEGGGFDLGGRHFRWRVRSQPFTALKPLYKVGLSVEWKDGRREWTVSRDTYVTYKKKEL